MDEGTPISIDGRIRGCLLGGAIGDALGAQVEFVSTAAIAATFGSDGPDALGRMYGRDGAFTDDTQMTLFTAEGLVRALGSRGAPADVAGEVRMAYLRWLHTQQEPLPRDVDPATVLDGWLLAEPAMAGRRAPGNSCLSALRSGGGSIDAPVNNSKGCGAVMRMAPVGLVIVDPAEAFTLGAELGAITHGHPSGYLPAGAFAAIVAALVGGATMTEGFDVALHELEHRAGHDETSSMLRTAIDDAGNGPPSPADLDAIGQGGWWGSDALAITARVALSCSDPRDALRRAVNHGGDSDSTGALVGNLVGAARGDAALPTDWLAQLDGAHVVERIAEELTALPTLPA